jgi:hypothetical protein
MLDLPLPIFSKAAPISTSFLPYQVNHKIFPPQRNGNPASFADYAPSSVDINIENPSSSLTASFEEHEQRQHLILVGPQAGHAVAQQYESDDKDAVMAAARMKNNRGNMPQKRQMKS